MKLKTIIYQFICAGILCLEASTALAGSCSATFSDGITSNSANGSIIFDKNSLITGNPDTVLAAANVNSSSSGNSCGVAACTAGGTAATAMSLGPFLTSSSNTEIEIAKNSSGSIGNSGTSNYKKVDVGQGALLASSSNYNSYRIEEMSIGKNAVVQLTAGEYWVKSLEVEQGASIQVSGSGTVKLYLYEDASIGKNAQLNAAGDPSDLFIYSYKKLEVDQGAWLKGYVYVTSDIDLGKNSLLTGSVSGKNVYVGEGAQIALAVASLNNTDFGGLCSSGAANLDHYEISHDGSGTICATESINIKACANAACSSLYGAATTLDFMADGNLKKALNFTGSATFNIAHSTAETLTLSIANASVSATNATVCSDGSGNSCDIAFSATGCPVAGACAASFVDGLTNANGDGSIIFQNDAYLTANPDTVLASALVQNDGSATTCSSANCSAGGNNVVVAPLTATFVSYTSSTDLTVDATTEFTDTSDFQDVEVKNGGILTMDSNNLVYTFSKLTITEGSVVNVSAGDYYIEELEIDDTAKLNIIGSGTVRLLVKDKMKFKGNAVVNNGIAGNASQLLLYFFAAGDDTLKIEDNAQITGFFYSVQDVEIKESGKVYGGVSAAGEIKVKNAAVVTARTTSAASINFGVMTCQLPVAGVCAATFPDALSNSDYSGNIKFENTGKTIDNPDTVLTTATVNNNGSATTCTTADCTASGSIVPELAGSFIDSVTSSDLVVEHSTATISNSDWDNIEVKDGGTLNMSGSYTSYTIDKLTVKEGSTINMTAGDYYIRSMEIKETSYLNVIGSGTVRIWSKTKAKFKDSSVINGGSSGNAAKLFIYYYAESGDSKIKIESGAAVAGFLYSANKVEVKGAGSVYGAISAAGEIKIKNSATVTYKSSALASADFGTACDAGGTTSVDHYRFEYDGTALTCAAEGITVSACGNADCSSTVNDASLTFVATSTEAGSTPVSLNLVLSGGSATVSLAESALATLTLSLPTANPSAPLKCYQNNAIDASCDYDTTDTGFIFLNESDANQVIPMQISGKPSNTGFNSKNIVLQAVQTDVNTGSCAPLFANNTSVGVEFAYECVNPSACTSNVASITNSSNTYSLSEYPAYTSHDLLFTQDSKASVAITYADAGSIKLYARKSVTFANDTVGDEVKVLLGNSNSFVVRPFGFYFGLSGNPGASDSSGGVFKKAGQSFDLTVSAVAWAAGEDADNNGIPDNGVDLSNNVITQNFGQEAQAEAVILSTNLIHPLGGINPALNNASFGSFSAGSQTKSVSWDEVGVITLNATADGDYMGTSSNIVSTSGNIGRFVPDHFRLLSASISQACGTFSYMGQTQNLVLNLAAQNAGDDVLSNYTDGHAKAAVSIVAENSNDGVDLGGRFSPMTFNWNNGAINASYTPNFARLDASPWLDGPFDNTLVGLKVADGESSVVIPLLDNVGGIVNMNAADTGSCLTNLNCDALQISGSEVKYRYGRLKSLPSFGPATEPQALPLTAEYYTGSAFAVSSEDNCSAIAADEVILSSASASPFAASYNVKSLETDNVVGITTVDTSPANSNSTTLTSSAGQFNLLLTSPNFSQGNMGYVPVIIDLSAYPWLQFDWDTAGTGAVEQQLPKQNMTFGQFRGNDRVIYWREKH